MKRTVITKLMILLSAVLVISSCGGGGGGGNKGGNIAQPTAAVLKIATQGALANGTLINGIEVTVVLPAGVTVKSTTNPPETDSGVVVSSGAGANSEVKTNYGAGTVGIFLANATAFGAGEFVTVNCDIATGSHPAAADFTVSNFKAKDLNGAAISGLTPGLTADIH